MSSDRLEAIKFPMEQEGPSPARIRRLLGTRTQDSGVLNRKRRLPNAMIRRLHEELGISADVLIRPTRHDRAA